MPKSGVELTIKPLDYLGQKPFFAGALQANLYFHSTAREFETAMPYKDHLFLIKVPPYLPRLTNKQYTKEVCQRRLEYMAKNAAPITSADPYTITEQVAPQITIWPAEWIGHTFINFIPLPGLPFEFYYSDMTRLLWALPFHGTHIALIEFPAHIVKPHFSMAKESTLDTANCEPATSFHPARPFGPFRKDPPAIPLIPAHN